jgi:hypothetical protein
MFRLIHLQPDGDTATVHPDRDGYTSQHAAWAAYVLAPQNVVGVGRFDPDGRMVELVVDPTRTRDDEFVALDALVTALGASVRCMDLPMSNELRAGSKVVRLLSGRIRSELAGHVDDPVWRSSICTALAKEPLAIDGLVEAIRNLDDRQVLDLFPALWQLAAELPEGIRRQLRDSADQPLSNTWAAALRLGLV